MNAGLRCWSPDILMAGDGEKAPSHGGLVPHCPCAGARLSCCEDRVSHTAQSRCHWGGTAVFKPGTGDSCQEEAAP